MAKNIVYHGSNVKIEKPQIIKSKKTKDFGHGFYCTVIKEQAERWAKRFDNPVVNMFSFLPSGNLNILEFAEMTENWLRFIVSCRAGTEHDHDIVIGPMANDQVYNYVSDFIDGVISREQFWALAKFKYPTHQMCFGTEKALGCLRFESVYEVSA